MVKLRGFLLFAYVAVNFAAPFFVTAFCGWLHIPTERSGFVVAIHEALCSILSFIFLYSLRSSSKPQSEWERRLPYLFLFLALGDLAYGLDYYLFKHIFKKTTWILTHEIPYILTMGLLAEASIRRCLQNLSRDQRRFISVTVAVLSTVYFICSYKMVLSFQFPAGYNRPTLNYFTSYTYGVLQALSMGGLLVASLRTTGPREFLLWFLFISMNGSDFALRYQDVGRHSLGTPMFEYGWELAVVALSCLSLYRAFYPKRTHVEFESQPSPIQSIRVLAPLSTLGILFLFISLSLLISPYFKIANINTVSGHTLIFAFTWIAANWMGIYLSRVLSYRISKLNASLESTLTLDDIGSLDGNLVELNPVIQSLLRMKVQLGKSLEDNMKMKSAAAVGAAASEVAHNIRSPLSSLEMGLNLVGDLPEPAGSIVTKSLREIQDIVQDLSIRSKEQLFAALPLQGQHHRTKPTGPEQIELLLISTVSQKQLEYRDRPEIEIVYDSRQEEQSIFCNVNAVEFSVMISNLINNSVEAMLVGGSVRVAVSSIDGEVTIQISDNGKGIEPDILPQLGQPGFTSGKPGGSGLGLYHAKTLMKDWGGSFSLSSEPRHGTVVTLMLRGVPGPSWFVSEIVLPTSGRVCIVDDDPLIHSAWNVKLGAEFGGSTIHFQDPTEFKKWFSLQEAPFQPGSILYLIDFEFKGHSENGLDLIEDLSIAENSILVTGHSQKATVIQRCQWLGTRMMTKSALSSISVKWSALSNDTFPSLHPQQEQKPCELRSPKA